MKELDDLINYLQELVNKKFTGKISINLHKGDISKKVHKEFVELIK